MSCKKSSIHSINGKNYAAEILVTLKFTNDHGSCSATDCYNTIVISFLLEVSKLFFIGLCAFFGLVKHKYCSSYLSVGKII